MTPGYGGEEVLFLPDNHSWYLSLEHALLIERDKVEVLTRVLQPGETAAEVPPVLVGATFAQTYVWPVFRHLCHLGL